MINNHIHPKIIVKNPINNLEYRDIFFPICNNKNKISNAIAIADLVRIIQAENKINNVK
jgi:hypothetical protein